MDSLPMTMDRDSLQQLLGEIDTVLLDCDGVLWQGAQGMDLIPRANEVVSRLQAMGKNVFLITNNSTRTQDSYHEKCRSLGFNVDQDHILSAPYILAQYLKEIDFRKKVYVPEKVEGSLYNAVAQGTLGLDPNVGAVAVGFDRDFNYDKLLRATSYLANPECLFLATNTDKKYVVTGTRHHLPAAGILVNAIENASSRPPRVMGKPSLNMLYMLQARYNVQPEKTLIIGDTLDTDILLGNECGMWTVLVLSGVTTLQEARQLTTNQDPQKQKQVPLFYLQSVADILTLLDEPVSNQVSEQQ
ncbi:Glycerol-3-phosphate phosphatase-like 2 [Homarus americanus]|uniref:Glycerol-3-phosphate phosphatase-like 2 n=1 Tax=Homarus americanus TaxID=6706 RepID=A0A8J5KAD2_HOMAM|nr:Glycerol-3-phosphate phosphatase-like 2 [Homarus americanus]